MKLSPVQIPSCPRSLRVQALAVTDPRFEVNAAAAIIDIFDVIGDGGTTPAKISAALASIGNKAVTVRINSPGGIFHDGLAIYNLLVGHQAGVTAEILGIAASAAAVVAMGADEIRMARASQLMVHRAQGGALGNAGIMRQVADALDKIDSTMAGIFSTRTGMDAETITAMMVDETYLNAGEAVQLGFADRLMDRDAVAAPQTTASRQSVEQELHRLGFSRTRAPKMAAAAWAQRGGEESESPDLDLGAIAAVLDHNFEALKPFLRTN